MIGWLSGTIQEIHSDHILMNVGGVGYEIFLPKTFFSSFHKDHEKMSLYIHTHVREDAITLYGFQNYTDKSLFLHLVRVSGIGAKTAMIVLSTLNSNELVQAILMKDTSLLQTIPGIGKKTAERLVIELSDRLKKFDESINTVALEKKSSSTSNDVISALLNFGYKRQEAEAALSAIECDKLTTFDKVLREALRILVKQHTA